MRKLLRTIKGLELTNDLKFFGRWFNQGHIAIVGKTVEQAVGHNYAANAKTAADIFRSACG